MQPTIRLCPGESLLAFDDVPMDDFGYMARGIQPTPNFLRDHHRPVTAAGATDADRQVALAFRGVVRD